MLIAKYYICYICTMMFNVLAIAVMVHKSSCLNETTEFYEVRVIQKKTAASFSSVRRVHQRVDV